MLNLLEKIQYGLSGLVVIGALTLYLWQGTEHRSVSVLAPPTERRRPPPPPRPVSSPSARPAPRLEVNPEDQAVLDRLASEQNVKGIAGKPLERKDYEVDPDTFDYLNREANWTPELKKANSLKMPGADGKMTRLKLFEIDPESLLKLYKFQDGDIIEFINGERVDFDSSAVDHIQRWKAISEKIKNGGKVPITITRGMQPMQLEFGLK